ncbi:hypothetical protein [Streptomyces noursei]|uniref:hypothetical protein n=1 Tax=Streptomyces noursei TaxID=1971 RepID=UPI0030F1E16A
MLRGITKSADVSAHPDNGIGTLTQKLPDNYKPTIRPLIKRQSELFGVSESTFKSRDTDAYSRSAYRADDEAIDSEVFAFGSILIIINVCESTRARRSRNASGEVVTTVGKHSYLTVTYLIPFAEDPDVSEFENTLAEVWLDIKLSERRMPPGRLREIDNGKSNSTKAPTGRESAAAELLSEKSVRMLAIAIKSANGLLLGDASKQIPPRERSRIDELVEKLINKELIDTEIVIICTKTSAQINRLPSPEAIEQLDQAGLRCACGRLLSAEKHEKALSITDFGRSMLDGNRWLSILVLQYLIGFGVPIADIRMEQIYSGEEVDCLVELYGRIVLFELKDKEFNRGNAYSFGAKIGIFQPDVSVVVTTEKVGADARDHFVARSTMPGRGRRLYVDVLDEESVTFIEGLDSLESGLESVVTHIAKASFAPALRTALSFANPGPFALLSAWAGEGRGSSSVALSKAATRKP